MFKIVPVVLERNSDLLNLDHYLSQMSLLGKERDPSFEQTCVESSSSKESG